MRKKAGLRSGGRKEEFGKTPARSSIVKVYLQRNQSTNFKASAELITSLEL